MCVTMDIKHSLLILLLFTLVTLCMFWFRVSHIPADTAIVYIPPPLIIILLFLKADKIVYHEIDRGNLNLIHQFRNTLKHTQPPSSYSNSTTPPILHMSILPRTNPQKHGSTTITHVNPKYYWRNIDNSINVQLKLFSAYYDDRFSPEVYVLGYENHEVKHDYYCVLGYQDRVVCSKEAAKRVNVNDDVDPYEEYKIALWGFYYICKLPTSDIPTKISISLSPICTMNSDSDWLPVENREKRAKKAKFGVCVQGPVYNIDNPQIVVEFMELHRALGAEIVTVYVQTAGELVWRALQQYADEGLVDLVNWNLTFVQDSGYVHYRGQSLLVNECLYRNMNSVEYLAMNDLDEVIVPLGESRTWSDMLPVIEGKGRGAFLFGHTTFTKEYKTTKNELLECRSETGTSLKAIEPPRFMKQYKQFRSNGYEKFMIKPVCSKKVSFHRIFGFVDGYSMYKVPSSIGMSYHYRDPPLPTKGRPTSDDRLQTLFPGVLEKIRERLCALL